MPVEPVFCGAPAPSLQAAADNPEAEVIFADEPTGNLDSKSGGEVMDMLKSIRDRMGKTLVIITHDNRIAAMADRILTIMDGVLSEVAAG